MKAGMVTQIRVNPKDCLAVLDIMVAIGVDPYDGRSFAQCVSLALSSLIGVARRGDIITREEDGFQYLNRMAVFLNSRNNKKKHTAAESLYRRAAQGIEPPQMHIGVKHPGQYTPPALREQSSGWTESGPSATAAVPMLLDEGTKELLWEEMNTLNERLNNGEVLPAQDKERYDTLNNLLFT